MIATNLNGQATDGRAISSMGSPPIKGEGSSVVPLPRFFSAVDFDADAPVALGAAESVAVQNLRVMTTNTAFSCNGVPFVPPSSPPTPPPKTPLPAPTATCADFADFKCGQDPTCQLNFSWTELEKSDFSDGAVSGWTATQNPGCGGRLNRASLKRGSVKGGKRGWMAIDCDVRPHHHPGLKVDTCGSFGRVLGGVGQLVRGSTLSKTLRVLPAHNKALLRFKVLTIDSWDNGMAVRPGQCSPVPSALRSVAPMAVVGSQNTYTWMWTASVFGRALPSAAPPTWPAQASSAAGTSM
jgi:hypothetical protein